MKPLALASLHVQQAQNGRSGKLMGLTEKLTRRLSRCVQPQRLIATSDDLDTAPQMLIQFSNPLGRNVPWTSRRMVDEIEEIPTQDVEADDGDMVGILDHGCRQVSLR